MCISLAHRGLCLWSSGPSVGVLETCAPALRSPWARRLCWSCPPLPYPVGDMRYPLLIPIGAPCGDCPSLDGGGCTRLRRCHHWRTTQLVPLCPLVGVSGAGPIPKALRDGRLRRDAPGAPTAEPEATEWRRLASAFVMGAKENEREDQGEGLQRRLCRLNSYDLGAAVDWSLRNIGAEGFWQFIPEPAPQRLVELRPLLIMGCDQASPNMCLVFALLKSSSCG